jgi:hypothetical protein
LQFAAIAARAAAMSDLSGSAVGVHTARPIRAVANRNPTASALRSNGNRMGPSISLSCNYCEQGTRSGTGFAGQEKNAKKIWLFRLQICWGSPTCDPGVTRLQAAAPRHPGVI